MAGQAEPGRLIGGRYRLRTRLGAGGMGRVWLASDEALRIDVAVKEVWLPESPGRDADERLRRAEREARNAARLRDHPNVVAVHDVVVEDGVPWTVMQLVAGHTLEEHVAQYGPLSVAHAAIVADALLDALEAAHAAGIVHRDVKPANVMLADDGKVLLTDFGIAIGHADTALTQAGTFLGSVEYIAPERARGTEGLAASDLFSLGVTLFQAVEGFSPFHRETATGTLTAVILDGAPAPARAGRLAPVVMGLLEKDPAARLGIAEARRLVAAREAPAVTETVAAAETAAVPASGPGNGSAPRPTGGAPSGTGNGAAPRSTGGVPRSGGASGRGHISSTGQRRQAVGSSRGTADSATPAAARNPLPAPPRGQANSSATGPRTPMAAPNSGGSTASRGPGAVPPRRPGSQGTDRNRQLGEPRRATGTANRSVAAPVRRSGLRPRAVILLVLVGATVAAVVFAVVQHSSFSVSDVKVGDFVKVDPTEHITAKLSRSDAIGHPLARKVLVREDGLHPNICAAWHYRGLNDVETQAKISFCLENVAEAAAPAQ